MFPYRNASSSLHLFTARRSMKWVCIIRIMINAINFLEFTTSRLCKSLSIFAFSHFTEVRSLCPANFGECVFVFRFTANFVSLSFSPSGKYIVIGLRCKKRLKFAYILDKDTRWKIGVDFRFDLNGSESRDADTSLPNGKRGFVRWFAGYLIPTLCLQIVSV